mgnify:CR=1 FL=1
MRTLSAPGLALLARMAAGEQIPCVQLVQMDVSRETRMAFKPTDLPWPVAPAISRCVA